MVNCDLKSFSYLSSQLPSLKDQKWDADKQYKVASTSNPIRPESISNRFSEL
jgi:hypothetical protein